MFKIIFTLGIIICLFVISQACGDSSLVSSIETLVETIDKNKDEKIDRAEIKRSASNEIDLDDDSCISKSEWVRRLSSAPFNFTRSYAAALFGKKFNSSEGSFFCDGLTLSQISINGGVSKHVYISRLVQDVVDFCESSPDRYLTVRECRQLPLACQFSSLACSYACLDFHFNIHAKRSGRFPFSSSLEPSDFNQVSLETVFDTFIGAIDLNKDGVVTPDEDKYGLRVEDRNDNGCSDRPEFLQIMTTSYCDYGGWGFSIETANNRFNAILAKNGIDYSCGGSGGLRQNLGGNTYDSKELVNVNIFWLIEMCESDHRLYQTNRDCQQVFKMCVATKYKTYPACVAYVDKVIRGKAGFKY